MTRNQATIDELMAHLERACREAGVKVTRQRREVFREVARSPEHPDAEMVVEGVRQRLPNVSLDTVYRTLWLLQELGLITTLCHHGGRARFDANLGPHHHFVCLRCGLTRDFQSAAFDALEPPAAATALGRVQQTHVEVRGLCQQCLHADEEPEIDEKNRTRRSEPPEHHPLIITLERP